MNYMELIQRSLSRAWKYKCLWLFGFFVSAVESFGSVGWKGDAEEWEWLEDIADIHIDPTWLILGGVAVFAIWIVFWVMSVLSEGALIHGIVRGERGLKVDFGGALSTGVEKFLRLFGIILLATMAIIASILTLVMVIIPSYFISVPIGVLLTLVAVPLLIGIILTVVCVEGWALRFAVIEDRIWSDAIGDGWQLFRRHIGPSLGVAFSSFLTQFFLWCALILVGLILAIPFIIMGMSDPMGALIPGVVLGLVVIIIAEAYFGTFASSIWTLGFMRLRSGFRAQA
jgi:hypothetical protein